MNASPNNNTTMSSLSMADRDADLARELQRAMDQEDKARRQKQRRAAETPLTSRTNSESSNDPQHTSADYDLALKMEQELIDEQLARQLAAAEQQRMSQTQARRMAGRPPNGEPPRQCSMRRVMGLLVPTLLVSYCNVIRPDLILCVDFTGALTHFLCLLCLGSFLLRQRQLSTIFSDQQGPGVFFLVPTTGVERTPLMPRRQQTHLVGGPMAVD